jgi:putative tributyrin esterase
MRSSAAYPLPMQRWACLLLLFFCASCRAPIPQASVERVLATDAVTITDVRFPSPSIGGLLRYRAIVPSTQLGERLPVLYLLHGANSGPAEIQQRSEVVQLATSVHLIVVMPEAGFSYYTNARHLRHARWEDAIVSDLPRDVEARFPVLQGREHRGIAGISMGGYGAVKLALKHPEFYGFAATMSGALDITRRPASLRRWWQTFRILTIFGLSPASRQDEDIFNLLDHAPADELQNMKWFSSCGKSDPLYAVNVRFIREMRQRGVKLDGIATPGFHDWQSWNAAMPLMFKAAGADLR